MSILFCDFFQGFFINNRPFRMAMVSGVVASMAAFYHDTDPWTPHDPRANRPA